MTRRRSSGSSSSCSWRRTPTRPSRSSSISTRPTTPSTVARKAASSTATTTATATLVVRSPTPWMCVHSSRRERCHQDDTHRHDCGSRSCWQPAAFGVRESVEAGGLMSYGPSFLDLFRRSATFVDKILKGAKPADLPIEQPVKFELVINLRTAKALGLEVPLHLQQRAD